MAAPKKKIAITEDVIISAYTDYSLTHGKKPNSVYEFAKQNGMTESDFYQFFISLSPILTRINSLCELCYNML